MSAIFFLVYILCFVQPVPFYWPLNIVLLTRKPSLSSLLQLHDFTGENISGYSLDFCACKQHLSSLLCSDTVSLVWLGVRSECIYFISGFRAITRAASANQNVTNNIPLKKSEEWPLYVPHRLKHSYGAQDWMIPSKTDNIHKSSCPPVNTLPNGSQIEE